MPTACSQAGLHLRGVLCKAAEQLTNAIQHCSSKSEKQSNDFPGNRKPSFNPVLNWVITSHSINHATKVQKMQTLPIIRRVRSWGGNNSIITPDNESVKRDFGRVATHTGDDGSSARQNRMFRSLDTLPSIGDSDGGGSPMSVGLASILPSRRNNKNATPRTRIIDTIPETPNEKDSAGEGGLQIVTADIPRPCHWKELSCFENVPRPTI